MQNKKAVEYRHLLIGAYELQNKLNLRVNPNIYNELDLSDWVQAVYTELAEGVCSLRQWEWWSDKNSDYKNLKIEIIDAWHFVMSYHLTLLGGMYSFDVEKTIKYIDWYMSQLSSVNTLFEESGSLKYDSEEMSGEYEKAVSYQAYRVLKSLFKNPDHFQSYDGYTNEIPGFVFENSLIEMLRLTFMVGISFNEFIIIYTGKNVLNIFRQDNGYKKGEYIKMWNGKEDNVYLTEEILAGITMPYVDMEDYIYRKLEQKYQDVIVEELFPAYPS